VSYISGKNFGIEVALGRVAGYAKVNKFGQADDCDSGVATDIWDGADGALSTDIWVAPTTARTHDLKSSEAADASAGTGMRTVQVYGLTAWDAKETSETVTLNGITNVATANAYVIIHRMKGVTFGADETNAGNITATAQTDTTITAAIKAGEGQTLMLIYGIASGQKLCITAGSATALKGVSTARIDATWMAKENADQSDCAFVTKMRFSFSSTAGMGGSYSPPLSYTGPCIVKLQVVSDTNGVQVAATFDAYVVDI